MSDPAVSTLKTRLRHELRKQRRSLSPRDQARAGAALCRHLLLSARYRRSRHIALYHAIDGEISLRSLAVAARRAGKTLYLPAIDRWRGMQFHCWPAAAPLRRSSLGYLQPAARGRPRSGQRLDLVLVPVVGFDHRGHRLGMGGGHYDRYFARLGSRGQRPWLVGVAHSFQLRRRLPRQRHDRRLRQVVTERGPLRFRPGQTPGRAAP